MADKIQLRRDITNNWTSTNPILSQGECGYDLILKILKIGDGITNWNNLDPYIPSMIKGLVYIQSSPSSEWMIIHNLNGYPTVTVIDSAGSQVEGSVVYTDLDTVTITFSSQFSGKAILK